MVVDADGNIYIVGDLEKALDFDPGSGTDDPGHSGGLDMYVAKYDSSMNLQWVKRVGSGGTEMGYGVAVDPSGNVFVLCNFSGTADFDPGAGTTNLTSSDQDMAVLKLNSSGDFVWVKQFGGTSKDEGRGIVVDDTGNVYFSGYFKNTVDWDPGSGTYDVTTVSAADAFICKLSASGDFKWVANFGSTSAEITYDLAVDRVGNVYGTGYFNNTCDFDPSSSTANLSSEGQQDVFIVKLDPAGQFVWVDQFGSGAHDVGVQIVVDNMGYVYVSGYFNGNAKFNPGSSTFSMSPIGSTDVFVMKISPAGNFMWGGPISSTDAEEVFGLDIDHDANIYVTGYFSSTCDFDLYTGTTTLVPSGGDDVYVAEYDSSGTVSMAYAFAGSGHDKGYGVGALPVNGFCVTGTFASNTMDCDPSTGLATLSNVDDLDVFVVKMNACIPPDTSVTESSGTLTAVATGVSYLWYDCTTMTAISSETSASFTPSATGSYAVIVSSSTCTDTSGCHSVMVVGVENIIEYGAIKAYPNPADDVFNIELPEVADKVDHFIYSINGKLISSGSVSNSNLISIDLDMIPGYYLVELRLDDGERVTVPLVVE